MIFGTKLLCFVLSIAFPKRISSPGIRRKTENSEKKIDLIRQRPISPPILNFMNIIATSPPMVVRLLAQISGIALLSATTAASCIDNVLCSTLKRLQ